MAEKVGEIYYDVTLETQELLTKSLEVEKAVDKTASSFDKLEARLNAVAAAAKAAFMGMSVMTIIDTADQWGQYASRIKMATRSTEEYNLVQARMLESANRTYRSINETREGFIRMSPALRDMGLSLNQSIDAVDAFSGLLVVNAASADRGASALAAYSKSLQKGRIDSDAWETIASTMPSVIDLIAKSTGKAADEIRKMGAEGKLTTQDFTAALVKNLGEINKQVEDMPTTVRDALQTLANGFTEYIGWSNEAHGITATLASTVELLGDKFAFLANVGLAAATGAILRQTVAVTASTVAKIQDIRQTATRAAAELTAARADVAHTSAVLAKVQALNTLTVATTQVTAAEAARSAALARLATAEAGAAAAATLGGRALAGVLGFLAGPAGAAVMLGLTAAGFLAMGGGADSAKRSLVDMSQPLDDAIAKFKELQSLQQQQQIGMLSRQLEDDLKTANAAVYEFTSSFKASLAQGGKAAAQYRSEFTSEVKGLVSDTSLSTEQLSQKMLDLINRWSRGMGWSESFTQSMVEQAARMVDLQVAYRDGIVKLEGFTRAQGDAATAVGTTNDMLEEQRKKVYGDWMKKYATDTERLNSELAKAREELGGELPKELEQRIRLSFTKPKSGGSTKSDSTGYLAGLSAAVADEWKKVDITESEALRAAADRLRKGELTAQQHEQAKTLIHQKAAQDREELSKRELAIEERNLRAAAEQQLDETYSHERQISLMREEAIRQAEAGYRNGALTFQEAESLKTRALRDEEERRTQLRRDRQQTELETLQIRVDTTGNPDDQRALAIAQAQAQLDAVSEMQALDLEQTQIYADQKKAIIERLNTDLLDIQAASNLAQYSMLQSSAGDIYSLLEKVGKERTALGKATFLAERALAVATILINTEVAAAKAVGQLGIFGVPMSTMIRATGYASAAMVGAMAVADVAGARQYGGPTESGKFYRVNETGQPEMFTASNGNQYMLGSKSGSVTPADQVGQTVQWNIVINNTAAGTQATASVNEQSRTVEIAVATVAMQIKNNEGQVWSAMKGSTNIASRL